MASIGGASFGNTEIVSGRVIVTMPQLRDGWCGFSGNVLQDGRLSRARTYSPAERAGPAPGTRHERLWEKLDLETLIWFEYLAGATT